MNKVINYVKNGKGIGLLFVLAAAVVMTLGVVFLGKRVYNETRPQIMLIAEDFLPLKVKDGKIVEPAETYKQVSLNFGEDDEALDTLPIVLDTREESGSLPKGEKNGLYIMKDKVYLVSQSKINMYSLPDGVWDVPAFEEFLDYYSGILSGVLTVVFIAAFFLMNLFKALAVAVLGVIGVKVMKADEKVFDFSALMRCSAVLVSVISVAVFCLELYGAGFVSWKLMILLAMGLEWLLIFKDKSGEAEKG